ncbi:hypothetical protein E3N88_35976 [Mikania micrantha]|uniref:Retrotransposon gag domain-containing protein n=1 Tax=Mikania micrantha TaxID=192012 RepID=A0A5N6M3F5_9ASTR|nr:hypothetical protein E3N88_35976 [Mikania micrantha]
MVNTLSEGSGTVPDPVAAQLAAIASSFERTKRFEDRESSWNNNRHFRPYNKIDFPTFNGGDPRGWVLKAEKYFRYYQVPEEEQVDAASMHFKGDALDLFSWLSTDQPFQSWDELVHAFQRNFGPAEFQNPDEHLCSIHQTGSMQEYRQEFAKRSSRVTNWPHHCLLGVFLNGLKEETSIYINLELFISNELSTRATKTEKQNRYLHGECLKCGDKYGPGHRAESVFAVTE